MAVTDVRHYLYGNFTVLIIILSIWPNKPSPTTCNMIKEKEAKKVRISHCDGKESPTVCLLTFMRGQTASKNMFVAGIRG